MNEFVRAALNGPKGVISDGKLVNVLSALGIDVQGQMTKVAGKDIFVKGIITLCDYQLWKLG